MSTRYVSDDDFPRGQKKNSLPLLAFDSPDGQLHRNQERRDRILLERENIELNLNFEHARLLWNAGLIFFVSSDRKILVPNVATVLKIKSLENRSFPPTSSRGSFNSYYMLTDDEAKMIQNATGVEDNLGRDVKIGLRRSRKEMEDKAAIREAWEEAWMALKASCRGLHPHIYACFYSIDDLHVYYAMADMLPLNLLVSLFVSGATDLANFRKARRSLAPGLSSAAIQKSLESKMQSAAEFGLLMTDIKPSNIVVDPDTMEVFFIDLGSDFARLDDADADCIFFINATLLVSYMLCHVQESGGTFVRILLQPLRVRIEEQLEHYTDPKNQLGLCAAVVKAIGRSQTAGTLWAQSDPRAVVATILERAVHYCKDYAQNSPPIPQAVKRLFKTEELSGAE